MKVYDCGNCGASFDQRQTHNRCGLCGFYLTEATVCDICQAPMLDFFNTTTGRELCYGHFASVLADSIVLEGEAK